MQFELPGTLDVPDGRYLARDGDDSARQTVLVVATLEAPPPPSRRQRAHRGEPEPDRSFLPLTQVTAVRAFEPFDSATEAAAWLEQSVATEDAAGTLVAEGTALLNRALHTHAVVSANPRGYELDPERAVLVRIGYGSGEELAAGRFSVAHDIDVRGPGRSRRRRRENELRPQERLAAVLGGRERVDACETLLLRARADLDAGRTREAALQLRGSLEALLVELEGALLDPSHTEDMAQLQARRAEATATAETAVGGELSPDDERTVRELLQLCERVLRRRRVLRG